jgi:uroporphyrinogen decarboxylase
MKRKERFLSALERKPVDRVPLFDFLFQRPLYKAMIGREPESYNARDAIECALALDMDGVWLPFGGFNGYQPQYLGKDVYVDEWGTTYQQTASSWPIDAPIDYPIKTRADLTKYKMPDPTLAGRDLELRIGKSIPNDDIAITGGITGPLTTAWLLMGYEALAYAMYDDPELVKGIFQITLDFYKEAARLSVAAGVDGMWISEDYGDSTRPFFRLPQFRKYVLPFFAELVEYTDNLGVPVLLHSCGCIKDYLPDLAQTRIKSVHPLQRTAGMDLRYVKETYGDRFCIIGNIDSSRTLPFSSADEVEAEVREAIAIAAPGYGYILASDHSLHDGIPIDNIVRMFRVGAEYGRAIYQR